MSRHIAETIWQQLHLAGAMLPMSWGTHALKALPEGTIDQDFDCQLGGLQIMVHGALFKGHVRILLDWDDTYIVRIGRSRKGVWKEHLRFNDLYADDLAGVIDTAVETAPKVVATRAVDHVSEDSPAYAPEYAPDLDRDKLDRFIMDEDNPMTCPACGARTVMEHTYEDGEQLHFCENDSCNTGYFLGVEPEEDERLIERVMTARSALRLKGSGVYFEPEEDDKEMSDLDYLIWASGFYLSNSMLPEWAEMSDSEKDSFIEDNAQRTFEDWPVKDIMQEIDYLADQAQSLVARQGRPPETQNTLERFNELKDIAGGWDELEEAVNDYFYKNLR